jgi:hypothetical protein
MNFFRKSSGDKKEEKEKGREKEKDKKGRWRGFGVQKMGQVWTQKNNDRVKRGAARGAQ